MSPVLELLRQRFSPKAFDQRGVGRDQLDLLFEAARWSPSCYNDQPWYYVVTRQGQAAHARLLDCLVPANQGWAATAPVLVLGVARQTFEHNGQPNRWAWYDLGQATAQLLAVATELGLSVHQMAGFDAAGAAHALALPPGYDAVAVSAIGYRGDPARLPDGVVEKDPAARERKPLDAFVFHGCWGDGPADA